MVRITFLIGLSLIINLCFSQRKQLDSLINLLNNHPQKDTVRLNILNDIAYTYYSIAPDKGLETADQAIALAEKLNNKAKLALAYRYKGTNHWAKGEDDLALENYKRGLAIYEQLGDRQGMAKIYNNFGLVYFGLSDY